MRPSNTPQPLHLRPCTCMTSHARLCPTCTTWARILAEVTLRRVTSRARAVRPYRRGHGRTWG